MSRSVILVQYEIEIMDAYIYIFIQYTNTKLVIIPGIKLIIIILLRERIF